MPDTVIEDWLLGVTTSIPSEESATDNITDLEFAGIKRVDLSRSKPPSTHGIHDLLNDIEKIAAGLGVIPSAVESLLCRGGRNCGIQPESINHHYPLSDHEAASEFGRVRDIIECNFDCVSEHQSEASWDALVYHPLLRIALDGRRARPWNTYEHCSP